MNNTSGTWLKEPEETDEPDGSKCPFCGHVDTAAWEYFRESNGNVNVNCPKCDKPLTISMEVSYSYRSWPQDQTL